MSTPKFIFFSDEQQIKYDKSNGQEMFVIEIKLGQLHPSIIVCRYPVKINQYQCPILIQTMRAFLNNALAC